VFIVLEGIDGSGKTTLAAVLADKLGGVTYATPPKRYRESRKEIDISSDLQSHYAFYRDAVTEASDEIATMLSACQTVVCDRYWLSTLVYHRAGGMLLDGSDFSQLVQPDLTVFLIVSPKVQVVRSLKRGVHGGDINGAQDMLTNFYWGALFDSKLPFIAIHTDVVAVEKCSDIIMATIAKCTKNPTS
jgi:thymidylate kinase